MENLLHSWPWYVAGPIIGLFVPLLLLVGNKLFGLSSSFDHICDFSFTQNIKNKIKFNKSKDGWKIYFIIGITIGAAISTNFLTFGDVHFLPSDY